MFYLSTYQIRFSPNHLSCCYYVVRCTYLIYPDLPTVRYTPTPTTTPTTTPTRTTHFTLAARGLEELFSNCAVVSVFGSGRKQVLVLLTYLEYNTVVALCQLFGSGRKQFLVLHTYLEYSTIVRLCQFFGCGRKQFSK